MCRHILHTNSCKFRPFSYTVLGDHPGTCFAFGALKLPPFQQISEYRRKNR